MSWRADELDGDELREAERTWVRQYAWVLETLAGPLSPVEFIDVWAFREQCRARMLEIEAEIAEREQVLK